MHIPSEVSSTTNSGHCETTSLTIMHSRANGGSSASSAAKVSTSNSKTSASNSSPSGALAPLTAENFAERTIDGLLAEHPGELVRTGCPHVVSEK